MFTYKFIVNYGKFSDFSYTLIVNGDYPEFLQRLYKGLPFLLENVIINEEWKLA